MMKQLLFSFTLLQLFLLHCTTTFAQSPAQAPAPATPTLPQSPPAKAPATPTLPQSPPAKAPAPPAKAPAPALAQSPAQVPVLAGPTDINKILDKAGKFKILIRLLKSTEVGDRINTLLNKSQGLTVFAPTDGAFSSLQTGTLNSLTDQQHVQLVLFHVIPTYLPTSQFQTVTNPLRTQAGDSTNYQFPLNVTTSGSQVNVSTGIVNATVDDTVYSDNLLAVYQVDKVLLPLNIFGPKPPPSAPAPAPTLAVAPAQSNPKEDSPVSTTTTTTSDNTSGAVSLTWHGIVVSFGVAVIAAFSL